MPTSFNGKFRDECLSVEWFRSRREAQVITEAWRQHHNSGRRHSSLRYLTPHEFKQHHPPIHDQPPGAISPGMIGSKIRTLVTPTWTQRPSRDAGR
jgi:hypothetical protein